MHKNVYHSQSDGIQSYMIQYTETMFAFYTIEWIKWITWTSDIVSSITMKDSKIGAQNQLREKLTISMLSNTCNNGPINKIPSTK